ncbi:MAG: hypothetical protein ABL973_08225 [Micropepsaceae bacterium]
MPETPITTQLPFAFELKRSTSRDDFVPGLANAEALAFVDTWPDWPGRVGAIWGPRGSGKTHLSQIWRAAADAVEIVATDLTVERVAELDPGCAVLIDGAGEVMNGAPLFHLVNFVNQSEGWLLLTGEHAPQRWPTSVPDLHSRLTAVAGASLDLPDEALMARVLLKLSADRQLKFPEALIDYLVPRLRRSFADAEKLVALMDFLALEKKRSVTIETASRALRHVDDERNGQSADNADSLS